MLAKLLTCYSTTKCVYDPSAPAAPLSFFSSLSRPIPTFWVKAERAKAARWCSCFALRCHSVIVPSLCVQQRQVSSRLSCRQRMSQRGLTRNGEEVHRTASLCIKVRGYRAAWLLSLCSNFCIAIARQSSASRNALCDS